METNYRAGVFITFVGLTIIVGGLLVVFLLRLASSDIILGSNQQKIASIEQTNNILLDRLAAVRTEQTRLATSLIEVETQFCASDIVRNLMHANDLRVQSLLWQKVNNGQRIPTDNAFYPTVCNRPAPMTAPGSSK